MTAFQRISMLIVCLILISGCAQQTAGQNPTSTPDLATTPALTVATPTVASQTDPAATQSCQPGFRSFDHELLATEPLCIPENPERIIALDMASVEMVLLTEKTLLATSGWILSELPLLAPQFAERLTTVEDVGYPANLEKVALLKPDLILAVGGTTVGETIDVDQAQQIAPVVFADPVIYNDWKLGMRLWADVLNASDMYEAMLANYEQRISELRAALGDRIQQEISVIATSTYGTSLWMPDTPPGAILSDVGLQRPPSQRFVGEAAQAEYGAAQYIMISDERLDLADGDAIFFFTYASSNPETAAAEDAHLKAFVEKPIWQSLNAVKAGQAFLVPGYWWRSQTFILANRVLDDLFTHLAGTQATTPVLMP